MNQKNMRSAEYPPQTEGESTVARQSKRIHVVRSEDGWAAQQENRSKPLGTAPTQAEAQQIARDALYNSRTGGELITHGRDGKIRESDTIKRKDPYPPKG